LQVKFFPIKTIGTSCFLAPAARIAFLMHGGKEISKINLRMNNGIEEKF